MAADFSPDGKRLATAGGDGAVRLWDVAALRQADLGIGDELVSLEDSGEMKCALDVAFSPDGRWIGAVLGTHGSFGDKYGDAMIKVWDAATNRLMWTLTQDAESPYYKISFSQDGGRMAAGVDYGGQVTVWKLPDGQDGDPEKLFTIQVAKFDIGKINFSPDGSQLAVPNSEEMGIWDAYTGESIGTLPYPGSTTEAVYSSDGKRLAVAGVDGGRLFFLDMDELIAMAKAHLTRTLTTKECQKYLHMEQCLAP